MVSIIEDVNKERNYTKEVSFIGIIVNLFLLIIKTFMGIISGSQALIADSLNSAGDIFASVMSYIGARISSKPKDSDHPYGHGKAEYIYSQLIALSMIIAALYMFKSSIESILENKELIFSMNLIFVCAITIISKLVLFIYVKAIYIKKKSILIKSSMEDHRNDIFVTTGTIVGIMSSYFGYYFVDGIIGSIISLWICYVGIKIYRDSYLVLLDTNISDEKQNDIKQEVMTFDEVIHVDKVTSKPVGNQYIIILKMSMNGDLTLRYSHDIGGKIKDHLMKKFDYISDVIVHINPH